jgi:hypothetical protein
MSLGLKILVVAAAFAPFAAVRADEPTKPAAVPPATTPVATAATVPPASAAPAKAAPVKTASAKDSDRMVCKKVQALGTLFPKKTCKSALQWQADEQAAKDSMRNAGTGNNPGQ